MNVTNTNGPKTSGSIPTSYHDDLAEVQAQYGASSAKYEKLADRQLQNSDTIVVSGYGCALRVKNDALVIFPGRTHKDQLQRTQILYRGAHSTKRVILLSNKGVVSLDAIKWACEQGIFITMLDGHGSVLLSLPSGNDPDAALRRVQYSALDNGLDKSIARELIRVKTEQQIMVLKTLPSHPVIDENSVIVDGQKVILTEKVGQVRYGEFIWEFFEQALTELPHMKEVNTIRALEARLAMTYWDLLAGTPLRWKTRDSKKVPPHWHRITRRISSLFGGRTAQHAMNPYHAATNYAYAILQGQCKQALISQGFDTACGFLHADQLHRDSLVFDLMECHRPQVDQLVLRFFAKHTLSKGEFMSTKDGSVEFNPQFARFIAASCRIPQADIDASSLWLKELLVGS